jgi:hypothetical protein
MKKLYKKDIIGMQTLPNYKSPAQCYLLYRCYWDDGSISFTRGQSLHQFAGDDNFEALQAMALLKSKLEEECLKVDETDELKWSEISM